jgi:hypothetical protein
MLKRNDARGSRTTKITMTVKNKRLIAFPNTEETNERWKMALTRGDDIQIHQDNDNHNDDHNDDTTGKDQDTTGTAAATGGTAGSSRTTNFNLRVEQNKIPEFFGSKSKDTISAADFFWGLRTLLKQTGGQTLKTTTTLPTNSGTRLKNGSHQWSTRTTMSMINLCGQTSKRFSSKNTHFKPMRG